MKVFKQVGIIIISIILLWAINFFVGGSIGPASILLKNFIECIQLFLLGALFFWIGLVLIQRIFKKKETSFFISTLIFASLLLLLEIGATYLLKNANAVSADTKRYLTEYYMGYERSIPERSAECGRYDSALIYTYRANASCLQENLEFKDSIYINRLGLRDDDSSLVAPEIICLGDSYTMGWGVQQQKSFPQLLETKTGIKVLNAGISSYGTARETLLLNRLDTSNLKAIVIQYSYNDIAENNAYIKNDFRLNVPEKKYYDSLVSVHQWSIVYFPGKRSLTLIRIAARDVLRRLRNPGYVNDQWKRFYDTSYVRAAAQSFLQILSRSNINFKTTKVFIVDVNRYPQFDHHFIDNAKKLLETKAYPDDLKSSITFVDPANLNDQANFFPLDNHFTTYGHEVISKALIEAFAQFHVGQNKLNK